MFDESSPAAGVFPSHFCEPVFPVMKTEVETSVISDSDDLVTIKDGMLANA